MIRGIGIGWRDGDWGLEWNRTGRDGTRVCVGQQAVRANTRVALVGLRWT